MRSIFQYMLNPFTDLYVDFMFVVLYLLPMEHVLLLLLIIAVYLLQNSSLLSPFIVKKDGAGSTSSRSLRVLALVGAGVSGFFSFSTMAAADEAEHGLACPSYPWPHKGILSSYDHAS